MLSKHKYTGLAKGWIIAWACFAACTSQSMAAEQVINYSSSSDSQADIIIDSRSASICEKASLQNAHCLPARDFFGPHKRLANFSGILWLLGTAGLNGREHVLIVGNKNNDKEAMAGLLFLTGQRKITVLKPSVGSLKEIELSSGETRSKSREEIYQSTMRAERIVLRDDLKILLGATNPPSILDGRTENEYWGQTIRSQRGGHLPGARHKPLSMPQTGTKNQLSSQIKPVELPVSYAHNSYEGLVYLSRLQASGTHSRIYLEGWAGWASDGALHADSLTYPEYLSQHRTKKTVAPKEVARTLSWNEYFGIGIGGIVLALGGFLFGRTTLRTTG